jgi:hypothetical protein
MGQMLLGWTMPKFIKIISKKYRFRIPKNTLNKDINIEEVQKSSPENKIELLERLRCKGTGN